jgi:hypothetical protein
MQTTFDIQTTTAKRAMRAPAVACSDSLEGANPGHGFVDALVERSMR